VTIESRIIFIGKLQERSRRSRQEAKRLLEEGFYEGSISRAYYSMFDLAQAVLATKDISPRKHFAVILAFGEHFSKPGLVATGLHHKLRDAYEARQTADYEYDTLKTKDEADAVLKDAEEFATGMDAFLEDWVRKVKIAGEK